MKSFTIERNGTGIERNGTGIERTGTGIERTGTGIERTGTGIGLCAMVGFALTLFAAAPVAIAGFSDDVESDLVDPATSPSIPAAVSLRGDAVSLRIGTSGCELSGTGWLDTGYARIPLSLSLSGENTILVNGSGTGDKVNGSGTGDKVNGSGTGDKVNGSGTGEPTAAQQACTALVDAFSIHSVEGAEAGQAWSGVWGIAEVVIDPRQGAAVLVHIKDPATGVDQVIALEASVVKQ